MNPSFMLEQPPMVYYTVNYYDNVNNSHQKFADLQKRCRMLEIENTRLRTQIDILNKIRPKQQQKKKKRRPIHLLQKNFVCPYKDCYKEYASELAVNLHIKNKHNGGTKTQREALARQIVLAEQKGERMPIVHISFPPGYLKEFKQSFFGTSLSN